MANRKASLGTAHRRHPPLRAASPALAGTAPQPLAARRDVRRSTSIAERVAASVLEPFTPAPHRTERANHGSIDAKLVQLVGSHKRVLVIGRDTLALSRSLSSAGCRVSVVETRLDIPAGSATFSDRVLVCDPDSLDLERRLDGAPFEAIVVVQLIEHVRNPVKTLAALRKHLSAQGCLVAAVPNITHGSVRLAFLAGHSPADLVTSAGASPSHWYDYSAMQRTFDRAGFMITQKQAAGVAKNVELALGAKEPLPVKGLPVDILAMSVGRSRGAGRFNSFRLPSIAVWLAKGRNMGLPMMAGYLDGTVA